MLPGEWCGQNGPITLSSVTAIFLAWLREALVDSWIEANSLKAKLVCQRLKLRIIGGSARIFSKATALERTVTFAPKSLTGFF